MTKENAVVLRMGVVKARIQESNSSRTKKALCEPFKGFYFFVGINNHPKTTFNTIRRNKLPEPVGRYLDA